MENYWFLPVWSIYPLLQKWMCAQMDDSGSALKDALLYIHYNDFIMRGMASQITSLAIVYSIVYSGIDKKKTSKLHVTGLCAGNSPETSEFPTQMASNAENVSIWWLHHASDKSHWWITSNHLYNLVSLDSLWIRHPTNMQQSSHWGFICDALEAEIKWTLFYRHHFQMHFSTANVWIPFKMPLNSVSMVSN